MLFLKTDHSMCNVHAVRHAVRHKPKRLL